MEHILRDRIDPIGPLALQSRRLRLGVVGGGRIAQTQAMAVRLSDRWEIVAGALSSDAVRSRDGRVNGIFIPHAPIFRPKKWLKLKRSDGTPWKQ